jgi:uncharacterized membrane protein
MRLRSPRERLLQACAFEFGGLVLAAPLCAAAIGAGPAEATGLLIALAVVTLLWAPLHNAVFDRMELRLAGRVASDRPHRWRLVHALSHETTVTVVTLPLAMLVTDCGLREAATMNLVLTAFYAVYAYVFHVAYDRLRPVPPEVRRD